MLRTLQLTLWTVVLACLGCERAHEAIDPDATSPTQGVTEQIALQRNWKPEPQFGGFYAADVAGEFASRGIDIEIVPGGAGVPTVEMIGAGTVDFAIAGADELVVARAYGIDVVAIYAVYQTNPQGIMAPAARGLATLDDVFAAEGTLAIEDGRPYTSFLRSKYGFDKLKIVPSPFGDLTQFRTEPNYAMQCFVTSEPLSAKKLGLEATTFLIADSGFNPYQTLVVTSQKVIDRDPDRVKRMRDAIHAGWTTYLRDPGPTNEAMHQLNPTMDLATFAESAEVQKKLIAPDASSTPGTMTLERWTTLVDQMKSLGLLSGDVRPEDCFR